MSDPATTPNGGEDGPSAPKQEPPRLAILSQYVKDMSFENPRAPAGLQQQNERPEIQIRIDTKAQPVDGDRHEVVLDVNIVAKTGEATVFVLELSYGGLFTVQNVPQDALQPVLMIECPRLLFPFARRVVADATRDGGFPPLMIDPIDFLALYRKRLAEQQQAAATAPVQ